MKHFSGCIVVLVQVNQWLTWLETAEEEESEDEEYWGIGQSHVLSDADLFWGFFSLLIFPSFLFCFFSSCLSRSSCNHCYSSFHNEIVLPASQILFMLQVSILFSLMSYSRCFIHFNQLGFKSRQYLAGKCTSTQNLTHFCHLFTSGRSHQVLSQLFKNCLQKRELALQRGFLLF